jgi:broad specificity phosphatase PhoE
LSSQLILVRHAETDGNKTRYVGRENLPLNANGYRQAQDLAKALHDVPVDVILCSPMQRAIATAEPLAATRNLLIQIEAGLTEIDYGSLQGNLKGESAFSLRRKYADTPMPGGESLRNVWDRLQSPAAEALRILKSDRSVIIVSHYWSSRMLYGMLKGDDFLGSIGKSDFKPPNASAISLAWNGQRLIGEVWLHQPG